MTASSVAGLATKLRSGISGLAGVVASGPAGIVASLGISGLATAVQASIESIVQLGKTAKLAGVNFKDFQELKYAADQNLIGVDALADGLKELQLRTDEFVQTGQGPAAESFQRLGLDAKTLAAGLKDPAKLFETVIDRIKQLDKAAQIRIMDELFGGTAAEQFIGFVEKGSRSIKDLRSEGEAFGIVMDEEFLKKAEEANRKFNALSTVVGVTLKSAIVSAADSLYEFIDGFRDFQNQQSSTLETRIKEIGEQSLELETQILKLKDAGRNGSEKLSDTARDLGFETSKNTLLAGVEGQVAALEEQRKQLTDEAAKITDVLNGRIKPMDRPAGETWTPPVVPPATSNSGRSGSTKAAREEKNAVDDVIASLKEEIALVGASDVEREKMVQLRRAGVEATSAEGKQISSLVEQLHRQEEAERLVTEQRERGIEAAERLGQTMDDQLLRIVDGTFDARDALAALVQEILNATTNGKGLFGSLFSALASGFGGGNASSLNSSINFTGANTTLSDFLGYGGARAGGGDVTPGRIYRVNEYEDEFFAPSQHGRIIAPSKLRGTAAASETGRSLVEIRLGEGLVGEILQQSADQSVQIVRTNNEAQANYRQNGGTL
ncbi:phage tail tape measure protein [Rhizobium etli]|nr:phage tail tape measure protein [Rhizobium etli]